ncbi:tetratricopeptide repeat protein [Zhouia amylolytica]|uniref:tetratricopeptide repeat protein n=1 Tax=Zhouia amylolytica TaxID=376730 RepID=UPI0020CFD9F7|nr:tetratricopeptide repeat protein [Zhouia amylolytica]MCQ0110267.1 tetratricopeptide repeat protein [Zhouia amylolytica]
MKTFVRLIVMFWVLVAGAQAPVSNEADNLFKNGHYTKAINLYARNPSYTNQLKIAQAYVALGNLDKAILQYEGIVTNNPEKLLPQKELGKLYFKTKQFEKAENTFLLLTQKDSLNPDNHYRYGLSVEALGKRDKAKDSFKKTFHLDTTHINNIKELGAYYLKKKYMDSVHFVVDKGLKVAPTNAQLLNLKALAHYNFQEYNSAIPYFEQLIKQRYLETYIFMYLGHCYEKDWRNKEAIDSYLGAIGIDNANSDAYFNIGNIYRKEKQADSAIVYFKEAITVKRVDLSREYSAIASSYRTKRDYKKALDYYWLTYEQNPDDYITYYNICFVSDHYYQDPKTKIKYYQNYLDKFGNHRFGKRYRVHAEKRISELKAEIHLAAD